VLFVFGIGLTLGNHFVGQWADKSLSLALVGVLAALILLLALFSVTMNSFIPATITIFFLGVAAFGTIPPLQMGIMEAAKGAPNLASALNIGAFNLGNAGGAWVGGLLIGAGYPSPALALAAAGVSSIGLVFAILSRASLIR